MKVAEARITLGPVGRVIVAEAVELLSVPLKAVLRVETFAPEVGVTVTVTVVPTGILVALISMITGWAVVEGSVTSPEPMGFAGTATPATEVMARAGSPGTKTEPGMLVVKAGVVDAVLWKVSASSLMRPFPPFPPLE